METLPIEGDVFGKIVVALRRSTLFSSLDDKLLSQMASACHLLKFADQEVMVTEGEPSDSFYMILSGQAAVMARHHVSGEQIELARLGSADGIGEMGLLMEQPRSATVVTTMPTLALKLEKKLFDALFDRTSGFARAVCRSLGERLARSARNVVGNDYDLAGNPPDGETIAMLPMEFVQRHRVIPVKKEGSKLTVAFVEAPTPSTLNLIRSQVPGMEIASVSVDAAAFNQVLQSQAGSEAVEAVVEAAASAPAAGDEIKGGKLQLDPLLKRMVAEGASDLHLAGGKAPRWRIDGEMLEIGGLPTLEPEDVWDLLEPVMADDNKEEFQETNDTDYAYAIEGLARFRVNMFRTSGGACTVMRVIPAKILTMDQLGLPPAVEKFCHHLKGMVLVTGPTGSGKSTTLAAMIDHINKTTPGHIITLEDPIEFVHESRKCLVNQRELGGHTQSFNRALRAALREDPDIVLVGEMRDLETVELALEIANTGHLIFGTLHTTTAIGTIDRMVEMFPSDQQNQVRSSIADSLIGVVAQNLCKRVGGGRIGAYEVLVSNSAAANLIREGKTHQILSIMQTGKALGNTLLNEELAKMVEGNKVTFEEALTRTPDKRDLARRLGKELLEN